MSVDHSHIFQALAQCEHTLSKLGVIREAVDDTAGAAQVSWFLLLLF
jgi:prephenate dehydratase